MYIEVKTSLLDIEDFVLWHDEMKNVKTLICIYINLRNSYYSVILFSSVERYFSYWLQ